MKKTVKELLEKHFRCSAGVPDGIVQDLLLNGVSYTQYTYEGGVVTVKRLPPDRVLEEQ